MVHNDYGKYSGEEAVVDRFIADGRRAGIEIETLRRTSKFSRENFWGRIKGFFAGIYSFSGRRMMREALKTFKPDIVHIHNLYPFISPAVLPLCHKAGVTVIMTVHNYRLMCPTGLFLRDGKPCENCLRNGNERDCIRFNCEHDWFRSLGYALRNMVARRSRAYLDNVDYYCCLTKFQCQKLIEAGFPSNKIKLMNSYVKYEEPEEPNAETESWGKGFVGYVGRLSYEKGYDMLFEVARRHPEIDFCFAGTIREGMNETIPQNVRLCGLLQTDRLARFYENAAFIVIPSRCYEGFPIVLLEASSHGRCCVAPNHGAFPDLMTDPDSHEVGGRLFKPCDIDSLGQNIVSLWNNKELVSKLGTVAEQNYRKRFLKRINTHDWDVFLKKIVNHS